MPNDVKISLEPMRLQALSNIAMLKVAHAEDEHKREQFITVLTRLVDELNAICGAGMGIDVRFSSDAQS
jgi:hypothetical protein